MIYLASMGSDSIPALRSVIKKTKKQVGAMFSYYDLAGNKGVPPFRKWSWEIIMAEKAKIRRKRK